MGIDFTAVIRAESARLAAALAGVPDTAPVPTCPGWTAADLLWHITEVQTFWSAIIASGSTTDAQAEAIEAQSPVRPTTRAELLARRERATEDLNAALLSGPLDAPGWSWFPGDRSVGFSSRMQPHEATIHRVDAELTAGLPISPIASEVAAAGTDHVLDVMWNWAPAEALQERVGVVELRPTDAAPRLVLVTRWTGQAWGRAFTDQIAGGRAPADAVPDAVIGATVQELDLLVWSRPARGLSRSGDKALLDAFDELIAFGIQ